MNTTSGYLTLAMVLKALLRPNEIPDWTKLIEQLSARDAFRGLPAAGFVLRNLVDARIADLVADCETSAPMLVDAVDRFATNTGLRPLVVEGVVSALAEALGRGDLARAFAVEEATAARRGRNFPVASEPAAAYGNNEAGEADDFAARFELLTPADRLGALNRRLRVERDMEPYRGVKLDTPRIVDARPLVTGDQWEITLTGTLLRTAPLGSAQLHYGAYAADRSLLVEGIAATLTASAHQSLPFTCRLRCNPLLLARLVLFVD